jgi:hypothetical protein
VTLTGSGFTSASRVSFHGHAATFSVVSATRIIATVPAGATSGIITVTTAGGMATSATRFTIMVKPQLTLKLSGLSGAVLVLGKTLSLSGTVTPASLGGTVTLTVQREQSSKWLAVTSSARTISGSGTYSWTYRPVKKGTYRIKTTIAATAAHAAATTMWTVFTVR